MTVLIFGLCVLFWHPLLSRLVFNKPVNIVGGNHHNLTVLLKDQIISSCLCNFLALQVSSWLAWRCFEKRLYQKRHCSYKGKKLLKRAFVCCYGNKSLQLRPELAGGIEVLPLMTMLMFVAEAESQQIVFNLPRCNVAIMLLAAAV